MKSNKYFLILSAALLAVLFMTSCAKADDEFLHTNSAILSIEIQPAGGGSGITGVIDETTGEIFFPIPKRLRNDYDITRLMVRASLQYDAVINPSLSGLKDLSDPDKRFEVTVTAGDKGTRTYTLWAFYTRR